MPVAGRLATWYAASLAVVAGAGSVAAVLGPPRGLDAPLAVLGACALAAGLLGALHHRIVVPDVRAMDQLVDDLGRVARGERRSADLPNRGSPELRRVSSSLKDRFARQDAEMSALRAQARLTQTLLDVSPIGVLVVREDGRIDFVNATFQRWVTLRGKPVGSRPIEVIPVAEVQQAVDIALLGAASGEITCTSGARDLLLQSVPVAEYGAMVIVQDVTGFRQAERVRTDFVANVSHELRTPVAAIMGYAETLLAEPELLHDSLRPLVDAVHRNGVRLRDLFEDLLQLSRIEARRGELPLKEQVLMPLVAEALVTAADQSALRNQDFSLDGDEELSARVNSEALTAIVGNLALNASNYTPKGGRIEVRIEGDPKEARIVVQDTGVGIDPAHHSRIFERFYRVDEGRSRSAGGTGLGLAIVKHLALASGCRVTVRSELGKGSEFTVHIPRRAA